METVGNLMGFTSKIALDSGKTAIDWGGQKISDAAETVGKIAKKTKKKTLDETGISNKTAQITKTVGDHLDKISGVKLLEIVEHRLELQGKYNDILATKLDEALTRVQKLEAQVEELQKEKERGQILF